MSRVRSHALLFCLVVSVLLAGCGGFNGVVTPTLTAISPDNVTAGASGFTLTATGTNFVSGTTLLWDGVSLPTTVTSTTQLTAAVSAAQIATAGTVTIRVMKPDTTTSSALMLTINGNGSGGGGGNSTFSLTSISPSTVAAGSGSFTLSATGVGFISSSTITLNGTALATTVDSATQAHATVPATVVASPGTVSVAVSNSATAVTNTLPLTVTGTSIGPAPTLTALTPNTSPAGVSSLALSVTGTNFVSGSQILWNGNAMTTTFGSSTQLSATIPGSYFSSIGTANVYVLNPDSTISNQLPFTITVSPSTVPTLVSVSPTKSQVGDPGFTLTLTGNNFASGATAYFGSDALATTYVSATQLTAQVPASALTAVAEVPVTVKNPNSGASNPIPYLVGMAIYFGEVNDAVWDTRRNILYISQPTTSTQQPDTVIALDPLHLTATPLWTYSPGSGANPDRLALSADGKYLYVGLDGKGTVQQLVLGNQQGVPGTTISLGSDANLGNYYAMDLQVSPQNSATIAVARGVANAIAVAQGGVAIYDGATQRPNVVSPTTQTTPANVLLDTIQWSADATMIYAANNENDGGDFYTLSVSANGVAFAKDYPGVFSNPNLYIHYDATTGLVYGDDGIVVNPATGAQAANFIAGGVMTEDSTIGNAYFVGQPSTNTNEVAYEVQSYSLAKYSPVATLQLYQVEGIPQHVSRWGTNGLVFTTKKLSNCVYSPCTVGDGRLYVIDGPFVTQTAP